VPAIVRTVGSWLASARTTARPGPRRPVARQAACWTRRPRTSAIGILRRVRRGDSQPGLAGGGAAPPRGVGGGGGGPRRGGVLLDSRILELLAPTVDEDDQVQGDPNRHGALDLREVWKVLRHVDGAAQQDQFADREATLACQHCDAPAVAVREEVQALETPR